ncbi:MAG TPA: PLP-dependent aminotransferase family protein, partial [Kribbella sp.]|nr:PLP-dependent aminotransferase family protein [Kribbella sp.]
SLVGVAQRHGVLLVAGSRFSPDGGLESFIRLPYTLDPDTLRDAVQRLADSYAGLAAGPPPRRTGAMIA